MTNELTIKKIMKMAHKQAKKSGWWEGEETSPRNYPEQLALFHSEISEALEEYRMHGLDPTKFIYYDEKGKPLGLAIELADLMIRLGDTCEKYKIPLEEAIKIKMVYNSTRGHRHGEKKC